MREHKESYDSRYELYVTMYRRIHMLRQLQELVIFVLPILLAYIYVRRRIKDDRSGEDRSVCGNTGKY